VTIIEYSDFQCPFCAEAAKNIEGVLERFPDDVQVVFKQFPLEGHPQAEISADALAAQAQGRFWEMHDRLYSDYPHITPERILVWAQEIGLDMVRFQADLSTGRFARRVALERKEGEALGVTGTPTFFIDGRVLTLPFNVQTVVPLISHALRR